MVYVKRNQDGCIVAVSREQQPVNEGWESLPANTPEVVAFADILAGGQKVLAAADLGMARVVEDLIHLLLEHEVIRFTDFPHAAQEKLLARRSMRCSLRSLKLLEDEGEESCLL